MARLRGLVIVAIVWCYSAPVANARQGGVPSPAPPPAAPAGASAWDWSALGPLQDDKAYKSTLRISNGCKVPATFTLTSEVPWLTTGGNVTVLPGGSMDVQVTLYTPPRPAAPTEIDRRDPANPIRKWRAALRGRVRVAYAGYEDANYVCYGTTGITDIVARVEWAEYEPQKDKTARADDCTVWWNTSQPPPNNPNITEDECVEPIRTLAADYRERALVPRAKQDSERWAWLPSAAQIVSMSISELLAMKARAASLMEEPAAR